MVRNEGVSESPCHTVWGHLLPASLGGLRDCVGRAPPGGRPLICLVWWPQPESSWRNLSERTLCKFCKLWFNWSFQNGRPMRPGRRLPTKTYSEAACPHLVCPHCCPGWSWPRQQWMELQVHWMTRRSDVLIFSEGVNAGSPGCCWL